jgi:hypothetical protein
MLVYVKDLIKASMRVIGVLAKSESPEDDEYTDTLQALNFMMDSWSVRSLLVLGSILEGFPVVANTRSYTIGPGGVFNTTKPTKIDFAFVRDTDNNDAPLDIYEQTVYNAIEDKITAVARPMLVYFDPGYTQQVTDLGTLFLYPIPDKPYTLFIGQQKPLTNFNSIDDLVSIQPAYYEAIKYQLAIRIYREFHEHNRPIPDDIIKLASSALLTIESMNSKQVIATMDFPDIHSYFNILTGDN